MIVHRNNEEIDNQNASNYFSEPKLNSIAFLNSAVGSQEVADVKKLANKGGCIQDCCNLSAIDYDTQEHYCLSM